MRALGVGRDDDEAAAGRRSRRSRAARRTARPAARRSCANTSPSWSSCDPADERGAARRTTRRPTDRVRGRAARDLDCAGPSPRTAASARSASMSAIAPVTRPCSATNSSVSWLSTSTSALPMRDDVESWSRVARSDSVARSRGRSAAGRAPRPRPVGVDRLGRRAQAAADGRGAAVERGALLERAAERLDDRAELGLVELLAVARAGGARDVLVHQRAAEVVGSRPAAPGGRRRRPSSPTTPGCCRSSPRYAMRPTACISSTSRNVGPAARLPLQEDRRRHVHERQRHELGEAAGLLLQRAGAHEVAGDVHRPLDVPEHDRDVRAQADRVRGAVRLEPLLGVDLVGADDRADLVVEDLGRGAGQRREPGLLQPASGIARAACRAGGRPR